jgi:hypothetical protein
MKNTKNGKDPRPIGDKTLRAALTQLCEEGKLFRKRGADGQWYYRDRPFRDDEIPGAAPSRPGA